jgi:hypothetical protein
MTLAELVVRARPHTHTLRIGFRPTDSDPLTLRAGADVVRRVVLSGLPVGLDTVRVAGLDVCRALKGASPLHLC